MTFSQLEEDQISTTYNRAPSGDIGFLHEFGYMPLKMRIITNYLLKRKNCLNQSFHRQYNFLHELI